MATLESEQVDMTFNPRTYWPAMGPWLAGPGAVSPEHIRIEALLRQLLPELAPIHSVLDVGCGRGRLASLLGEVLPTAHYTGLDIGEAQAQATQAVRPDGTVYTVPIQDFDSKHRYDLILVSEVLMHIPPNEISAVVTKLMTMATKYIVAIEWTEPIGDVVPAEWNWLHDYRALFGDGIEQETVESLQTVFLVRP
jgi:SAM-dependent methyltransferase